AGRVDAVEAGLALSASHVAHRTARVARLRAGARGGIGVAHGRRLARAGVVGAHRRRARAVSGGRRAARARAAIVHAVIGSGGLADPRIALGGRVALPLGAHAGVRARGAVLRDAALKVRLAREPLVAGAVA